MNEAFGYVDPGSGFTFLQGTSFLWGWIIAFLMLFLVPLRFFLRQRRKKFWIIIIIIIIILAICCTIIVIVINDARSDKMDTKKVIILGIDAMDPEITQKLMSEGKLPFFSALNENGSFSALATTNPAESVVAWSSFATGQNPGGHGVFDFVMRSPENYSLYLSLNEVRRKESGLKINIRRGGEAFWEILSKHNIPSFIYFCPNTFPPDEIRGRMLGGMGTPDILGLMGKFSFYTTRPISAEDKHSRGRIIQVYPQRELISTNFYGPKIIKDDKTVEAQIPLEIILKPDDEGALLKFQKKQVLLKKGIWSNWQDICFDLGAFRKAHGMVRFYLRSIGPDFELYVSPVNFNPQKPLFAISYPRNLSKKIARKLGPFYTQGMPYDTWALSEERLSEDAFLKHADMIFEERKGILLNELDAFKKGTLFFYFGILDAIQHMFWRYIDEGHNLYEENSAYSDIIFKYYKKIDMILGEVLAGMDKDTVLIVLSDHGFESFRKSVHLNRWLLNNGYLVLQGGQEKDSEFLEGIDWSKTSAYALGFGGIYINRIGREKEGIVPEFKEELIKKEIADKLKRWRDPDTQSPIIMDVYDAQHIFSGHYAQNAPDLFVGFNLGYRASWQTALGAVPAALMETNKKKWSGDHLVDPDLVEGLIFINKKIPLDNPHITDIASTVLDSFGVNVPEEMTGKKLFR